MWYISVQQWTNIGVRYIGTIGTGVGMLDMYLHQYKQRLETLAETPL